MNVEIESKIVSMLSSWVESVLSQSRISISYLSDRSHKKSHESDDHNHMHKGAVQKSFCSTLISDLHSPSECSPNWTSECGNFDVDMVCLLKANQTTITRVPCHCVSGTF